MRARRKIFRNCGEVVEMPSARRFYKAFGGSRFRFWYNWFEDDGDC